MAALVVELTEEDPAVLDRVAPARGDRYADMSPVNRYSRALVPSAGVLRQQAGSTHVPRVIE